MPNKFFKFKNFTVFHDRSTMRVNTDGVLLGAWAECEKCINILDIGTGSGLIAMMLAQRSSADITGIDIDKESCMQAEENIENSIYAGRIHVVRCDFSNYACSKKFDLIVSNPPYFRDSLKSPYEIKNLAKHENILNLNLLITRSTNLLSEKGRLCMILPYEKLEETEKISQKNDLYLTKIVKVSTIEGNNPKRIIVEISREYAPPQIQSLSIEKGTHEYTNDFIHLVKSYYLNI